MGFKNTKKCKFPIKGENLLLIMTVLGVVIGIIVGVSLQMSERRLTPRQIGYLKFPGEMFLRALKLLILPLIMSTLICSMARLDSATAGRLGLLATGYYLLTTVLAVVLGIILVVTIRPGAGAPASETRDDQAECYGALAGDTLMDLVRNMVPDNIVEAAFRSIRTCYEFKNMTGNVTKKLPYAVARQVNEGKKPIGPNSILLAYPKLIRKDGLNILAVVVFSIIFGAILGRYRSECSVTVGFFEGMEFAIMKIVGLVIWYSPFGILFLIAAQITEMDNLVYEMKRLAWYILTVLVGLGLHSLGTLLLLLIFVARQNPLKYIKGILQALLTALGTASSSATMPLTMRCLEENNNIDPRISRFMIPLGATINMDGTALYEAVAAIYIAQALNRTLTAGQVIITSLTATLASIGAAGIPQAGLVTMIMVLISVDLPPEYFVLVVPIDWFLDRIRTTVNVYGDAVGCAVVQQLCTRYLKTTLGTGDEKLGDNKPSTNIKGISEVMNGVRKSPPRRLSDTPESVTAPEADSSDSTNETVIRLGEP